MWSSLQSRVLSAPASPAPVGPAAATRPATAARTEHPPVFVARPFEGLASEADIVALREFVPAATAPLKLADSDRTVLLCSLLPGAAPALVREDGAIWLGLQVQHSYGDPSRDLAAVLLDAFDAEPGSMVGLSTDPGEGQRLQDLVTDEPLEVTVHSGFDYWVADMDDSDGSMAEALKQANEAASPTERLTGVEGAYWTSVGNREYLRWVLPHDEDKVLDGLARLHATNGANLVDGRPPDRDVPRARPGRAGLGPAPGNRSRSPGRPDHEGRGRARRGDGVDDSADLGGTGRARRADQPPADHPLSRHDSVKSVTTEYLRGCPVSGQACTFRRRPTDVVPPVNTGRAPCFPAAPDAGPLGGSAPTRASSSGTRGRRLERSLRGRQASSRAIGQDMHLGPPRPEPSSEPEIAMTSIPASSSRVLVSTLRS